MVRQCLSPMCATSRGKLCADIVPGPMQTPALALAVPEDSERSAHFGSFHARYLDSSGVLLSLPAAIVIRSSAYTNRITSAACKRYTVQTAVNATGKLASLRLLGRNLGPYMRLYNQVDLYSQWYSGTTQIKIPGRQPILEASISARFRPPA